MHRTGGRSTHHTRKMERVVTRMRMLGLAYGPAAAGVGEVSVAGERLAAIAALQAQPDPSHLDWLAAQAAGE